MIIIFSLIIALLLIGTSYIITEKNAKYYLSGYWNLTPEKRQQFNLKGFLAYWKRIMWISGAVITLSGIIFYFTKTDEKTSVFAILIMVVITFVVFGVSGRKLWNNGPKKKSSPTRRSPSGAWRNRGEAG